MGLGQPGPLQANLNLFHGNQALKEPLVIPDDPGGEDGIEGPVDSVVNFNNGSQVLDLVGIKRLPGVHAGLKILKNGVQLVERLCCRPPEDLVQI